MDTWGGSGNNCYLRVIPRFRACKTLVYDRDAMQAKGLVTDFPYEQFFDLRPNDLLRPSWIEDRPVTRLVHVPAGVAQIALVDVRADGTPGVVLPHIATQPGCELYYVPPGIALGVQAIADPTRVHIRWSEDPRPLTHHCIDHKDSGLFVPGDDERQPFEWFMDPARPFSPPGAIIQTIDEYERGGALYQP